MRPSARTSDATVRLGTDEGGCTSAAAASAVAPVAERKGWGCPGGRSARPRLLAALQGALFALALVPGCDPTAADITRWKQTEKGPGKLRAALASPDLPAELRASAAVALIDIRRGEEAEAALTEAPESSRRAVVHLALPQLVAVVQQGAPEAPPTRAQIEAKDGLFRLRALGDPDDRRLAEEALVAFCTADLPGRMSAGAFGTERVLLAVGGRAQGPLLAVLGRATLGAPSLLPAASLLGRVGDKEARRAGAERIVAILRPALVTPEAAASARGLDDALRALGLLGGSVAGAFLGEIAEHGTPTLRGKAFAALRETGDPSALDAALRVAWDKREPGGVREAAFAYLEKVGQIAVEGLCKIIADPRESGERGQTARFRAVEAALSAGGADAVSKVLAALPADRPYGRDDLKSYVVRQLTALGPGARPAVRAALQAPSWVARAAAVLALGEAGEAADAEALGALSSDAAPLRGDGWGEKTIGELARKQAEQLRKKR